MKKSLWLLFALLQIAGVSAQTAEPASPVAPGSTPVDESSEKPRVSPQDRFPGGLGVGLGLVSGIGFSYRNLESTGGWSTTGIAFYNKDSYTLYWDLGGAWFFPLGQHHFTAGFDTTPYLFWAAGLAGYNGLQSGLSSYVASSGPGLGLELLLFDHLSINFEATLAVTYDVTAGQSPLFRLGATPQVCLYYRFWEKK